MEPTKSPPAADPAFESAGGAPAHEGEATQLVAANEGGPAPAEQRSMFDSPIFWILLAIWAYWIWSMSRKRRVQGAEAERLKNLVKGDVVVTIGRMHGTVVAFTDDTVTIRPDEKTPVTMTFDRVAVYRIVPKPGDPTADGATR